MSASDPNEKLPFLCSPKISAGADQVIIAISFRVYSLLIDFNTECF